jgi:hypothetical protein
MYKKGCAALVHLVIIKGSTVGGKKHYKMRMHHMKALVKYVEQGGILETHDDDSLYCLTCSKLYLHTT